MNANIKTTVALATLAAGASLAGASGAAHATEGWYGSVDVGYSTDGSFDTWPSGGDNDVDNDWLQAGSIGYAFQDGMRMEGEFSHRFNEIEAAPAIDAGGDVHVWSATLNMYFDLNRAGPVQPYFGFGFGAARVVANGADATPPPVSTFDGRDTTVAIQGMAGIAFAIDEGLSLDIGYRAFTTGRFDYTSFEPAPVRRRAEYGQSSVTVGLRWEFAPVAAPPPLLPPPASPPPPPPLPPRTACPTQDFAVYFEWDRSNLNQGAMDALREAAAQARTCNVSAVAVVGHADRSGSAAYNIGLSERRASVVRDALASLGAPANLIATEARGETDLAQPTRDGVREPLNRRAVVTIAFR